MTEKTNVPEIRFAGFTDPWEQRKLGDVAAVYDGVHQTPDYQDEGVMFLSVENIETLTSQKFISREAFARDYPVYPKRGDVLMTRIGDIGTSNVVETDDKLAFYVSLALLKPLNVDSYYLDKSLQSPSAKMELYRRTLHIAFPKKINKNQIAEVMLPIPRSRQEQEQIGALFRDLDTLITLHQRKRRKRLFTHLLVWEQRKLGELCTFSKGHGYSKADIRDAGTPLILYGRLYTHYESHIEEVDTFTVEQDGSILSKGNEVIVPASGETAEDIAVASSGRRSGIILGGDLNVVTPTGKLDPDYTALAITYSKAHDDLAKRAQGKSVVHVHGNDIAEVEISYPSESEQKRISSVVLNLDSLITLHQ